MRRCAARRLLHVELGRVLGLARPVMLSGGRSTAVRSLISTESVRIRRPAGRKTSATVLFVPRVTCVSAVDWAALEVDLDV